MSDNTQFQFQQLINYLKQLRSIPTEIIVHYLQEEKDYIVKPMAEKPATKLSSYKEGFIEQKNYQGKLWKFPKYYTTVDGQDQFIFKDKRSGTKDQKAHKNTTADCLDVLFETLQERGLIEQVTND